MLWHVLQMGTDSDSLLLRRLSSLDEASKKKQLDAIKGIFELVVTNGQAKDSALDSSHRGLSENARIV